MKTFKITPALRFIEVDGVMNDKTPFLQMPGYPECGPSFYKLQQGWRCIEDRGIEWRDVAIDFTAT